MGRSVDQHTNFPNSTTLCAYICALGVCAPKPVILAEPLTMVSVTTFHSWFLYVWECIKISEAWPPRLCRPLKTLSALPKYPVSPADTVVMATRGFPYHLNEKRVVLYGPTDRWHFGAQ